MENKDAVIMPDPAMTSDPASERWDDRTLTLLGGEALACLRHAHVLVVGIGGVGGYAAEMLARSGVGHITLVDADCVAASNINRQLVALHSTVGMPKTELFRRRFLDINPDAEVRALQMYLSAENIDELLDSEAFDYVVDAIDTVAPKVALIAECQRRRMRIISSMGAGGRVDPTKVVYTDLWSTAEDGLARAVRQRLKHMGLRRPLKVVASTEAPRRSALIGLDLPGKRSSFGTLATVPAIFGIYLASAVINSLKTDS